MPPDIILAELLTDVLDPGHSIWLPRIGVDFEEIARVERADRIGGVRRRKRLFTDAEQIEISENIDRQAARHAAKEAIAKSLGTGFRNGLAGRHIEIITDRRGAPSVVLHGPAADHAEDSHVAHIAVSWARCNGYVLAAAASYAYSDKVDRVANSIDSKEVL